MEEGPKRKIEGDKVEIAWIHIKECLLAGNAVNKAG